MEITIIMQFIQAIMECIQERKNETVETSAERVHGQLIDASRRGRRRSLRMILSMHRRQDDMRGHELRATAQETFVMLTEAHEEDVASLVGDSVCAIKAMDEDDTLKEIDAINVAIDAREDSE